MIKLTDGEIRALNILTSQTQNARTQYQWAIEARESTISLLENKYNAAFNSQTGVFEEKCKPEKNLIRSCE